MSHHGRVLYRCGCVKMQCKCIGPHTDTWLEHPCEKHPDITIRLSGGDVTIKSDGRAERD